MSDSPVRLIASASDFERELLGSWESRQPEDGARARTLAVLGLGVAAGALAGTTALASGSIAPKAVLTTTAIFKWIALGAGLAATLGIVGYASYTRLAAPKESTLPGLVQPVEAPAPRQAPLPPPPRAPVDDLTVEPVPASPPRSAPRVVTPSPSASSLEEEVYAIDQARRALTAGNAAAALSAVDAYDARYVPGALAQESAEIRIEALYRLGKRPLADKLATRFLSAHPDSPYAREIRALMAATP